MLTVSHSKGDIPSVTCPGVQNKVKNMLEIFFKGLSENPVKPGSGREAV